MNCSVSAHILIRDSKLPHSTQTKLLNLTRSKCLYRFKVFLDTRRGLSEQRSPAGCEADKHSMFLVVFALTSLPSPPSSAVDSLWPSHPDLGGLFFFSAELTSLFYSIDSRLHFGWRERGSAPEYLLMLRCLQCLVLDSLKDA